MLEQYTLPKSDVMTRMMIKPTAVKFTRAINFNNEGRNCRYRTSPEKEEKIFFRSTKSRKVATKKMRDMMTLNFLTIFQFMIKFKQ
jgi:hypothetical protein